MNDRTMGSLWHSRANQLSPQQMDMYKAGLIATVQRQRRGLTIAMGVLVALLAFMIGSFLEFIRGGGAFSISQEWGAVAFLLLPFVVLAAIINRYFHHLRSNPHYYESVTRCLQALLDEIRFSQLRVIWALIALTCAMALLPLITSQLQAVDKQTPQESLSMLALFSVAYAVSVVSLVLHYRQRLIPRRRELERLLEERLNEQNPL